MLSHAAMPACAQVAVPWRMTQLFPHLPQSVTVVTQELIKDQLMSSLGDVMRYVPGTDLHALLRRDGRLAPAERVRKGRAAS